jgi:hypothetical protein
VGPAKATEPAMRTDRVVIGRSLLTIDSRDIVLMTVA